MNRYILPALSLAVMAALAGLSSCSKDDEPVVPPKVKVSFERTQRTIDEGEGVALITLILDRPADKDFTVKYSVAGTAKEGSPNAAGTDYMISSDRGEVKIKKGQASGVIELRIKDDALFEGDETVELKITGASSADVDISTDNTMKITLADNDAEARVAFAAATKVVNEDDGAIEVELVLDKPATTKVVLSYLVAGTATNPSDYIMGAAGEIEINEGQTKASIKVYVMDDKVYESEDETVILTIDRVATHGVLMGEVKQCTLTIQDDEREIVASFITGPFALRESNGPTSVVVKLSNVPEADVTIRYELSGSAEDSVWMTASFPPVHHDYAVKNTAGERVLPGMLVIPKGQTTGVIVIDPSSDYILEDEETVVIDLLTAEGYKIQAPETYTGRILQEDSKTIVLEWDPFYQTTDMDIVLWELDPQTHDVIKPWAIANVSTFDGIEVMSIPTALTSKIVKGSFGVSYTLYAAAKDPIDFKVEFIDCEGIFAEAPEDRDTFTGQYTLKNVNPYKTLADFKIEQTFDIVNGVYTNFSTIVTPAAGSRVGGPVVTLPGSVRKDTSPRSSAVLRPK